METLFFSKDFPLWKWKTGDILVEKNRLLYCKLTGTLSILLNQTEQGGNQNWMSLPAQLFDSGQFQKVFKTLWLVSRSVNYNFARNCKTNQKVYFYSFHFPKIVSSDFGVLFKKSVYSSLPKQNVHWPSGFDDGTTKSHIYIQQFPAIVKQSIF